MAIPIYQGAFTDKIMFVYKNYFHRFSSRTEVSGMVVLGVVVLYGKRRPKCAFQKSIKVLKGWAKWGFSPCPDHLSCAAICTWWQGLVEPLRSTHMLLYQKCFSPGQFPIPSFVLDNFEWKPISLTRFQLWALYFIFDKCDCFISHTAVKSILSFCLQASSKLISQQNICTGNCLWWWQNGDLP